MYRLLIVDDEIYAVQAVQVGIDWESLGFSDVYCAYDAEEAKGFLLQHPIDLMICDIEMPGSSGVELLEWTNEHSPATVTIMLTAHADFNYARQVVQLSGFDYVLKPIRYEQFRTIVERALTEVENNKEAKRFEEMYKTYAKLQESQKPLLKELFWQDLLSKRIHPYPEQWDEIMNKYQVRIAKDRYVMPILLSVEHWDREFTERDEEILIYALRNAASELLRPREVEGDVIEDRNGILFALLYWPDPKAYSQDELKEACQRYIRACSRYFYCSLSCYIGEAVPIPDISPVYHRLIELEQSNIVNTGQVLFLKVNDGADAPLPRKMTSFAFDPAEWTLHLEAGRTEAVIRQIEELFRGDAASGMSSETLDALYHTLLGFVYQTVHHKGGSVKQLLGNSKWTEAAAATRSVTQFLAWTRKLILSTAEYFDKTRTESSALVEKVNAYVESNLQSVTREELASAVYLNSAYLSRLYKRETGMSLMDYIISMKMNRAKQMLTKSNMKVSDICDSLGYENLSHFAKTFKKQVGITPQDFRKRYQAIG
ncbi:helix-turn-helix domain-containing protein [Paenibacillus sepulcri]|uniref:Helix-turn-helix domain-containing protein n=1 Tax=Paenibacillus sepulcri TaxID=359917 RepID=A0ABS7BVG3_9BACL|nr:helix-turn-helix domain-containing protein [Paenibacillus sepulcri]